MKDVVRCPHCDKNNRLGRQTLGKAPICGACGTTLDLCPNILCRKAGIEGYEKEKKVADEVLLHHRNLNSRLLVLMLSLGNCSCLYGQTNFKIDASDWGDYKFCVFLPAGIRGRLINETIRENGIKYILVKGDPLLEQLKAAPELRRFEHIMHPVTEACSPICEGIQKRRGWSAIFGSLFRSRDQAE